MPRSAITISAAVAIAVAVASTASAQRASQGEDEAATFVAQGRAALVRHDYDEARKALEQARTLNPRRIDAYVLLSAVYVARKQYKDGVAVMRQAQTLAPADPEVLLALGSDLVLAGDAAAGVPLLQQVVAKEPARYDAQKLLGHHFHDGMHWPEAIAAYEAYFAHRPQALANEDASLQIELADAYLRDRKPQQALALFQRAEAHGGRTELRASIGKAWALAAIDCKRARSMLHELEPVAAQHPEIWLVDGQCALSLGDTAGALAAGRRYLERAPSGSAAGHALVGEALAARGELGEARSELETARKLEPAKRRWTVQLAMVLRRAGHPAEAIETLDQLGAPATPAVDRDWWIELGEALLARGDAGTAATRLAPIAGELPNDAAIRTVLGAAQLAAGQLEAAVKTLDEAETIESTPRSKKLLAEGLVRVAAGKLSADDAAAAEAMLARAVDLDPSPVSLRDLGIAKLSLGKAAEAAAVFDRALKLDAPPVVVMLAARAHALAGDLAAARPLYERAFAAERDNPSESSGSTGARSDAERRGAWIEIALDWAASEVAGGDPAIAVTALEKTQAAAKSSPLGPRHKAALAIARHAAGLAALRAGTGAKAVELLRASQALEPALATKCDLAVAEVTAGDTTAALAALRAVTGQACPFPPPADTQAAPILAAFVEGLNPRKASRALERLTALGGKATGVVASLLGTSIRVVALDAAQDAYRAGDVAAARKYLAAARTANARVGGDEIAVDLAVLDLADGHIDAAIAELDRLSAKVPEALVDLGIAYERKGEQTRALDAWRRARKLGVRFAPLEDWISSKERIYGGEK
ncbi:MAG TPA: tetratricopeptide repeat protein [Kofleriaceae bacterium]|jgi:tetratricopeptide (TPR) repeat protein